jgi:hypothetical protein
LFVWGTFVTLCVAVTNILQDVYTHNGGVHVHKILIFIKYSQNDRQLDLVILFVRPDIDTWFVQLSPPTVVELQL